MLEASSSKLDHLKLALSVTHSGNNVTGMCSAELKPENFTKAAATNVSPTIVKQLAK